MSELNKKLDEYYSDIDKEKLWDRISSELDFPPEKQTEEKPRPIRRIKLLPAISAAAAVIVVTVIGSRFISPRNMAVTDSESVSENSVLFTTVTTSTAPEEYADAAEENSELFFPSERGWNYSSVSLSEAKSYSYSEFDDSVTPYFENNYSDEFFVESQVLESTDFFLDCTVEEITEVCSDGTVIYTVSPIHVICPEDMYLSPLIRVSSKAAYVLSEGREYLIPVRKGPDGELSAADSSAPGIMITDERYVIYHNGWQSLSDSGGAYLQKDSASPDDFFYDRMFICGEQSLGSLFDKFFEAKEK